MSVLVMVAGEGLRLRQFSTDDADAIFGLIDRNREHLSQHGDDTASKYPTREAVLNSIRYPKNPARLRLGIWAVKTFVGSVNLTPPPEDDRAEIGYYLGKEFEGKGYMGRSIGRVVWYGFEERGFKEIYGMVHRDNERSKAVLRKAGFSLDATKSQEEKECFLIKR